MVIRLTVLAASILIGLGAASAVLPAEPPIRIGVPIPLTGPVASGASQTLWGIQYAAEEANAAGGLFGRQIQLVVEDTKGDPQTSAVVAAKLATRDRVDAIVGGYGSTGDYALLAAIQRYAPIFIHAGASSIHIEQSFGKYEWYYHVYIWDYHRQKAAVNFFKSIPGVKTLAIAHEDQLFGSDASRLTEQYAKEAGLDVVMDEPFRSGSADFSPILSRVKAANPDMFFFIGYAGDDIQVERQAAQLGVHPKMIVTQGNGETRADFGAAGDYMSIVDLWSGKQNTPGLSDWLKAAQAKRGGEVVSTAVQGYVAMKILVDAARAAGSWDHDKILHNLSTMTFDTLYGQMAFKPPEQGGKHQLLSDSSMIAIQNLPDNGQVVVWPAAKASAQITYPAH